ncbi:MAG: iron-sulfur cluster assembly scaffold protein [Candidatus Peribacteraceae bacterium]|jgi:nitrogen fixation NifU-like protein|nr:iron-sulfur cluster assembly scaffold protein [Candidatus Peribacteraceae bacterium]HCI03894.1 Fe-S cluster protein [Candidatus Peribacteria bacterium]|tara:strand:+ start:4726 stop:5082 length:357 start_codon:yes stop_codon:yes gene_type:complete
MDLYAENILDHFKHPRGKRELADPTVSHEEVNLACGDKLTIHLAIEDGVIKEAAWEGSGCAISLGAMSILWEKLEGMPVKETAEMTAEDIIEMLGVPISKRRMKCALLCLEGVKNALK